VIWYIGVIQSKGGVTDIMSNALWGLARMKAKEPHALRGTRRQSFTVPAN